MDDADVLATETIESTQEMHEILQQDNRTLIVKLDLRDFAFEELNVPTFIKYVVKAANQGLELSHVEVTGAKSYWNYMSSLLPKYTKDRIVLK